MRSTFELLLSSTDESIAPVVDLCCHGENLQDTVEVTRGALVVQTIMNTPSPLNETENVIT